MKYIDLHCDTILRILDSKGSTNLRENNFQVDVMKLKKSGALAQFFAIFVDLESTDNPFEYFMKMFNLYQSELKKNNDILKSALSYNDIVDNEQNGYISSILTIEEGEVLMGKIDNLKRVYDLGVRLITLTWNYKNSIGSPNAINEEQYVGLTKFGKELVEGMKDLGMIVDVSHLSDGGFNDVVDILKSPFVASHSNARSVASHKRNLTDDMIVTLANCGGVMGLNVYPEFIKDGGGHVTVDDLVNQLKYIHKVGGIEVMAIGTDFDGVHGTFEMKDTSEMHKLYEGLSKGGFSQDSIEKIFYKNSLRVIKDIMK